MGGAEVATFMETLELCESRLPAWQLTILSPACHKSYGSPVSQGRSTLDRHQSKLPLHN